MSELKDYALAHPIFEETEPKFDALKRLNQLYAELSEGVHGSRVHNLEMRVALNKITLDDAEFKSQTKLVEKCAESVNFFLAAFHKKEFSKLHLEDRQIILHTMPDKARRALTELA
jgi:hypothetical protein